MPDYTIHIVFLIQAFVIKLSRRKWLKLLEYYKKDTDISPMRLDILNKYCFGILSLPSEKQSKASQQKSFLQYCEILACPSGGFVIA
jgi:hypothetical protein